MPGLFKWVLGMELGSPCLHECLPCPASSPASPLQLSRPSCLGYFRNRAPLAFWTGELPAAPRGSLHTLCSLDASAFSCVLTLFFQCTRLLVSVIYTFTASKFFCKRSAACCLAESSQASAPVAVLGHRGDALPRACA